MKKQKGFTGVEILVVSVAIMLGGAYAAVGLEKAYKAGCEAAGYTWSSDPAIGCSGLPRKEG